MFRPTSLIHTSPSFGKLSSTLFFSSIFFFSSFQRLKSFIKRFYHICISFSRSPLHQNPKPPPRIPPAPSCGAETRIPPNFKNISLGFANPPSRKIVSQNRVHFFSNGSFTGI